MSFEMARKFAQLSILKKEYEDRAKTIGAMIEKLGQDIYDSAQEQGAANYKIKPTFVQNGKEVVLFKDNRIRIVRPVMKMKVSCTKAKQEELFEWLRANQLGDLIVEHVHPATLTSLVKERMEKNQPVPEDCLHLYDIRTANVTKG